MLRRRRPVGGLGLIVLVVAACGAGSASPTPVPVAASFGEFRTAFCLSWEALFRAVGNPDTGSGSELSKALDEAISSGNLVEVALQADKIQAELEAGRRQIAFAAGFEPGTAIMHEMDRLFAGFQALVEARQAAAGEGEAAANLRGQAAFEASGALEAWTALLNQEAWRPLEAARPAGEVSTQCENVPVSM